MTAQQTLHLIEQFSAQAPFAIWVTDARGVAIFANKKLHDLLAVPTHPSGALGANLFNDPAVEQLGLGEASRRLQAGEPIDQVLEIERPGDIHSSVGATRKDPLTVRVIAYALRSSAHVIEHYVIILEDLTENRKQQRKLRDQLRSIGVYASSRDGRLKRLQDLNEEVAKLEKEIRELGGQPLP